MNSFVLLAKIVENPELRYTQDGQMPVAEMMVEFPGTRPEEVYTLKIVGWGNLANEIKEKYQLDDQVIIEGRLSMKSYNSPDGSKERKAELVASRLYLVKGDITSFQYQAPQQNLVGASINQNDDSKQSFDTKAESEDNIPF